MTDNQTPPLTDDDLREMKEWLVAEEAGAAYMTTRLKLEYPGHSAILKASRLLAEVERLRAENKTLTLKTNNSLANNLCPDHRDKQTGKPCLACEIERLRSKAADLADIQTRLYATTCNVADALGLKVWANNELGPKVAASCASRDAALAVLRELVAACDEPMPAITVPRCVRAWQAARALLAKEGARDTPP